LRHLGKNLRYLLYLYLFSDQPKGFDIDIMH
jgi:hypothetical protein